MYDELSDLDHDKHILDCTNLEVDSFFCILDIFGSFHHLARFVPSLPVFKTYDPVFPRFGMNTICSFIGDWERDKGIESMYISAENIHISDDCQFRDYVKSRLQLGSMSSCPLRDGWPQDILGFSHATIILTQISRPV